MSNTGTGELLRGQVSFGTKRKDGFIHRRG